MKIDIVYDNDATEGFRAAWGFSCFFPDRGLMFDTGGDAEILANNMSSFGIDRNDVLTLVISHDHWDHAGGIAAVIHDDLDVYILSSFSTATKDALAIARVHECDERTVVADGIRTTGLLSDGIVDEQALLVDGSLGLAVITGCAHPGVAKILACAEEFGHVKSLIGGFHGFDDFDTIKKISYLGACHCTTHRDDLRRLYPAASHPLFAGKSLVL